MLLKVQTKHSPFVHSSGKGKEVLVLLHGFLEDATMWQEWLPIFEERFRVVRMDFPGHGISPDLKDENEAYSMEALADLVNRYCLDSEQKVHILGHSMGGYVALAFAEKFPQKLKSLSLFFSTPLADSKEKKEQRAKAADLAMQDTGAFIRAAIPLLFHIQNPQAKEKALRQALRASSSSITHYLLAMAKRPNRCSVLEEQEIPVAIWSGEFDTAAPPSTFAKWASEEKNIEHKIYPCGHMGHYELSDRIQKDVLDFLLKSN